VEVSCRIIKIEKGDNDNGNKMFGARHEKTGSILVQKHYHKTSDNEHVVLHCSHHRHNHYIFFIPSHRELTDAAGCQGCETGN
jgi:hypothetical protein